MASMKALKLPPYNEDKDDLNAYLSRFERACQAFDVKPEHYYKVKPWMCISGCLMLENIRFSKKIFRRDLDLRREATI